MAVSNEELLRNIILRLKAPEPYDEKYNALPQSTNIEDRRNETGWQTYLPLLTGHGVEDWKAILAHPMTPYSEIFDSPEFWARAKGPYNDLQRDAGILNIGK